MPQVNIFRWRPGNGWIVLSGGGSWETEDVFNIESKILNHTLSQGPFAYIWAASDIESADIHMDSLRELGARTGYLIDVLTEEDDQLYQHLSEAGLIILGDGPRWDTLHDAIAGIVLDAMGEAFRRGATIYGVGRSAALFGAYLVRGGEWVKGYEWLRNAIIMPGYTADRAEQLRRWLLDYPEGYGLGLGEGAALALGPNGEVEVWGNRAVTISLGQNYDPQSGAQGG